MAINQQSQLSPTVYEQLLEYAEFKAYFHHMYIRAQKDPEQKWFDLPYLAIDDEIQELIQRWPIDWHSPFDLDAGTSKGVGSSMERKKEEVKQVVQKLVVQRRKEVEEKALLENECTAKQQAEKEQRDSKGSDKSPSPQTKEEEQPAQGDDGDEGQSTPFCIKRYK